MASALRAAALLLSSPPLTVQTPEARAICFTCGFRGLPRRSRPLRLTPQSRTLYSISRRDSLVATAAASGEATQADEVAADTAPQGSSENEVPPENVDEGGDGAAYAEDKLSAATVALLQSYKEALLNNDEAKVMEIESSLRAIEENKITLAKDVTTLTATLATERDRILRISADFDNFRKRTERERLSLMTNVRGEVIESLLPVIDNFERAKTQLKVETEGEEKINNSYQSIYKQFVEVLTSLGVESVETVGREFDPLFHEAIMREESTEFKEGVVIEEFRKGFRLGDRLLRAAMVKVSAGPGPATPNNPDENGKDESKEESDEAINGSGSDDAASE